MTYRNYEPERLTEEQFKFCEEWHDGEGCILRRLYRWRFDDKMRPVSRRQFEQVPGALHRLMHEMVEERKDPDVLRVVDELAAWAQRQRDRLAARETVRDKVRTMLDQGYEKHQVMGYVEDVADEWALPGD